MKLGSSQEGEDKPCCLFLLKTHPDTNYLLVNNDAYSIFVTGGAIHMVCRNKDKAEEARADIVKETGNKVECDSLLNRYFEKQGDRLCHSRCDIIH